MTNSTEKATPKPAEENPWYLLATLYGVPSLDDDNLRLQNRVAWNRFYANEWTDIQRKYLANKIDAEEITPFDDNEMEEIRLKFARRAGKAAVDIPRADQLINFEDCHFDQDFRFSSYILKDAYFTHAKFSQGAYFSNATFCGEACFRGANFAGEVHFDSAKFFTSAHFSNATFERSMYFRHAVFCGEAYFRSVKFKGRTNFDSASFEREVIFSGAELEAATDFADCRFEKSPPQFEGATLHPRTNWRRVAWPRLKGLKPADVEALTDAYCILKLEMDKQKRHEDELLFFAKELECRRRELGRFKGLPISLYWLTSDYGRSYYWPFLWLLSLFNAGAPALFFLQPDIGWTKSVGLSAVNCLAGFGLRKELMGKTVESLGTGALIVSGIQMVLGLILLFLIGLGLRNRFRMK
ncbi:pentapeptide repeat-containing protein [Niveispirillum lacus]|nr:pentapeptide repeat-containing protein [Niveispirillum lacus]